jgi:hypothetical protein
LAESRHSRNKQKQPVQNRLFLQKVYILRGRILACMHV